MNWFYIASNALWIVALAWAVALVGEAHYESSGTKKSLHVMLAQRTQRVSLNLVLVLFSLGVGFVVSPIWGKALWFILAIICLITAWHSFHLQRKS